MAQLSVRSPLSELSERTARYLAVVHPMVPRGLVLTAATATTGRAMPALYGALFTVRGPSVGGWIATPVPPRLLLMFGGMIRHMNRLTGRRRE